MSEVQPSAQCLTTMPQAYPHSPCRDFFLCHFAADAGNQDLCGNTGHVLTQKHLLARSDAVFSDKNCSGLLSSDHEGSSAPLEFFPIQHELSSTQIESDTESVCQRMTNSKSLSNDITTRISELQLRQQHTEDIAMAP